MYGSKGHMITEVSEVCYVQNKVEMYSEKPTVVFVPGAWNYPTYFQLVIDLLAKNDYPTATVSLKTVIPLDSPASVHRTRSHFEDAEVVRSVVQSLVDQGKEVIVLCHSYGGIPTTEALAGLGKKNGRDGGVINIIYCAAILLLEGDSLATAGAKVPASRHSNWNKLEDDGITLTIIPSTMKEALCADVDDEIIEKYIKIGLHSALTFASVQEKAAWREIPTSYIFCEKDNALPPNFQQWMVDNAQIKDEDVLRLSSSHSPFLSMPEEVYEWIEKVADENKRNGFQ